MNEYLTVIFFTLFLAWLRQGTYVSSPRSVGTKIKDRTCIILIALILTFFIGLRTAYNDTTAYIGSYNNSAPFPEFWQSFSIFLADNPGYNIVRAWLKTAGVSSQTYLLFFAALSILCSVWFLKKYSCNFFLSLFLFFGTNAYTLSAAALKQSAAMAISFIAIHFAVKKKWVGFVLLMLLAATFHPYVLIVAIIPFLTFKPWTKMTYLMLGCFLFAGFALESLFGTIVDLTSMIGDNYSEEALVGEGINIFRVLVSNVPLFLTFFYRKQLFRHSTRTEHLMINLSMVNGAVMFVGLFGTAIYFSRLASFFTIAQCIALPWLLSKFPSRQRKLLTSLMILGYSAFFLYANIFASSFDADFRKITFFQYIANSLRTPIP